MGCSYKRGSDKRGSTVSNMDGSYTCTIELRSEKTVLSFESYFSTRTMEARKRARRPGDIKVELSSENESRSGSERSSDSAVLSLTDTTSNSSDSDVSASASGPTSTRRAQKAKVKELHLMVRSRKPYRRSKPGSKKLF